MNITVLSWDGIYWISQLALVIVAGLALISGRIVNNRQTRQLAEINERASKANESASKSEAESNRLKLVVAEAERKRADAERALIELQRRVGPRHLTNEQRLTISATLKSAPRCKVEISFAPGNPEAEAFSKELHSLLIACGFEVTDTRSALLIGAGLVLEIGGETSLAAASVLSEALKSCDIDVRVERARSAEDVMKIIVADKL